MASTEAERVAAENKKINLPALFQSNESGESLAERGSGGNFRRGLVGLSAVERAGEVAEPDGRIVAGREPGFERSAADQHCAVALLDKMEQPAFNPAVDAAAAAFAQVRGLFSRQHPDGAVAFGTEAMRVTAHRAGRVVLLR